MEIKSKTKVNLKNLGVKIINLDANTPKGKIKLQAAFDVKYLYCQIRSYFEKELLSKINTLTDARLQQILNKKAEDIPLLKSFTFDSDVRIIELAVLVGVLETLHRLNWLNKKYGFLPAWQLPKKQMIRKAFSKKESWDGFIVGLPKKEELKAISIPLELKTTMHNPKEKIYTNPNKQLKSLLSSPKITKHFQHEGSLNGVLVMPYSDQKLTLDLKYASDDLRKVVSPKSGCFISLLTFPYDGRGKPMMSILFAFVSQDPTFMSVSNKDKWMCQINFGKTP